MRIILDTNCLLMIMFPRSEYHRIYKKIQTGDLSLAITTEIVNEYVEIISNFYSADVAEYTINAILNLPNTVNINSIYYRWELIEIDKDDNKFVDAYIASNANFLISNDKHFNVLKKIDFPFVNILNIDDFLDLIT